MPYVFLLAGWLLLYLEFFAPGGLLGVLGGLGILTAILTFSLSSTWLAALVFVIIVLVITVLLIQMALWQIRTSKKNHSLYLGDEQKGFKAPHYDASLIGKQAVTDSSFSPSGHILIEGQRLQAICRSRFLPSGIPVIILDGEGSHLVVEPLPPKKSSS